MSVATEITRIQNAKADLKTAIEAKGVTVPSATLIDGYAALVAEIPSGGGDDAMKHYLNNTLTSYTIPAGITSLHNYCFSHLTNLKSLTLNNDLTTIGESAFEYSGIENITIPSNVTNVKYHAFYYSDLKSITFKGDITLGAQGQSNADVFERCRKLEKIRYEGNVTPLGQLFGSSEDYITLETAGPLNGDYSIEYGFANLPEHIFYALTYLKYITFNTGITTIGNYSIYGNYKLKELVLPSTLTTINGQNFGYMRNLKELVFNSVTPPTWQSYNSSGVTMFDIIVPAASVEAYKTAFTNAENRIFAENNKPTYYQTTQLRYSNQTGTTQFTELSDTVLTTSNVPSSNLKVVHVSDSVTEIGAQVLNSSGIDQLWISPNNSIETIGNNSLHYVWSDVALPNIRTIGDNCFEYFKGDTLVLGNNLTSIGTYFLGYSNIENLVIPDSVTTIGNYFLYNDRRIKNLTVGKNLTNAYQIIPTNFYAGEEHDVNVTIRCTNVPSRLLYDCKIVTSLVLENTVETIGEQAFYGLRNITTLNIPNTVTSIGNSAFYSCGSLTSVVIPDTVTSIGNSAFYSCSSLTSFTCEATTPPTLGSKALGLTNNCPIYVPAESVEAYQTANNWSTYASRIQAIPDSN